MMLIYIGPTQSENCSHYEPQRQKRTMHKVFEAEYFYKSCSWNNERVALVAESKTRICKYSQWNSFFV